MQIKTTTKNLKNYKIYLQVEKAVNEFLEKNNYLKVNLPVLSPALIPESYLEVFETEFKYFDKKEKLYLTPSPELFLKRLLAYGIGDCYYLGRAYRNSEPNSDWHSPEFTMLEFYKVGVTYLQMADEILNLLQFIIKKLGITNYELKYQGKKVLFKKWEKLSVAQAFNKYSRITEKELFNKKLFFKKAINKGYKIVKTTTYEDIFSQILAQEIEPNLGKNGYPTLLHDYPKQLASLAKLSKDGRTAERCEFYINGLEIGGFCTELNDVKEQQKRFIDQSLIRKKNHLANHAIDKGFIEVLQYGLPDCTGAGIGLERLAMIFANVDSIEKLKLINIS